MSGVITSAVEVQSNPFIVLTFIVAPAMLTNASALMVLSTSNRFARAIDRGRDLSRQIEEARRVRNRDVLGRLEGELLLTEKRAVYLLKALRAFYFSLGGFAFGAFIALVGAGLVDLKVPILYRILEVVSIVGVFLAVGGLVSGSFVLFYESRVVVHILQDRITLLNEHKNSGLT